MDGATSSRMALSSAAAPSAAPSQGAGAAAAGGGGRGGGTAMGPLNPTQLQAAIALAGAATQRDGVKLGAADLEMHDAGGPGWQW